MAILELTDEQNDLVSVANSFLQRAAPVQTLVSRLDRVAEFDVKILRRIAGEVDLVGLAVPMSRGGHGAGLVELFCVFRESGRVLLPGGFLSAVLAADALSAVVDHEDVTTMVSAVLSGETLAVVAGLPGHGATGLEATTDAGTWRVSGTVNNVVSGAAADTVLAIAKYAGEPYLFAIADAAEVRRSPIAGLDLSRPTATLAFPAVEARRLDLAYPPGVVFDRLTRLALFCVAAEQVGAGEACLQIALEHAKTRHQFGQPIGSFQAVKHRCSDAALALEAASSLVLRAALDVTGNVPRPTAPEIIAKTVASEASVKVAASLIQVLGGIGYTWEHPAHLYYRRAIASRVAFGTTTQLRDDIATKLLADV
jgi:alkylation response protein AidB-like acyl-CoA dehydrogenase